MKKVNRLIGLSGIRLTIKVFHSMNMLWVTYLTKLGKKYGPDIVQCVIIF